MIREVETARPLYLIFVNIPMSWLVRADSYKLIFNWLDSYTSKYYEVEGVVDIISEDKTLYVWGEDSKKYTPLSRYWIGIYKRKEGL